MRSGGLAGVRGAEKSLGAFPEGEIGGLEELLQIAAAVTKRRGR